MSWTRPLAAALAATVSAVLLAAPAPAHAEGVSLADESGDTTGRGLDFTAVSLRNRDHAIVADLTFARDRRGEIIIGVQVRGEGLVARVVSRHRRTGDDRVFLLTGDTETACAGLRSAWDREAAQARLRVPSRCLLDGDYGAVRAWFLTEEAGGGSDVDQAPDTATGSTAWVSRG